jgi:hypothetical protein
MAAPRFGARGFAWCAVLVLALVLAPAAWAVGWVTVGYAEAHLNDIPSHQVGSSQPVYSSKMRLYVQVHFPCGGGNFYMKYLFPSGSLYAISDYREICTAAETPSNWLVNGGNKWAICGELLLEPTNPASTCQRYSTT